MRDREKLYEEETSKRSIRYVYGMIAALIVALMLIGCIDMQEDSFSEIYNIPEYSGSPSYVVNNNTPFLDLEDLELDEFVSFSNMDEKGRCGPAFGNITSDFMPTEERTDISGVIPSGWKQVVTTMGKHIHEEVELTTECYMKEENGEYTGTLY